MRTIIELDTPAFSQNIRLIKQSLGDTQLALVIKSNAYGHGLIPMAKQADLLPEIEWICTASLQEALEIKSHHIKKKLLILSYLDGSFSDAIALDIHCPLYDLETAQALSQAAQLIKKQAYVHIKVDTGMSRLGISPDSVIDFVQKIQKLPYITVYGIFTHLCDTPNPDPSYSYEQLEKFDTVLDQLKQAHIAIPCTHAIASSGLCITPKRSYTMARIGGLAFGLWKNLSHKNRVLTNHRELENLQPIMSWKTKIIQIKSIQAGSFIGYDRTYQAAQNMRIAILPLGYADGYPRGLSNNSFVLINNQLAPIIGIISMNLMTIDVSHIPEVHLNSEVFLIGSHPEIQAFTLAQKARIITNEFAARISCSIIRTNKPII
jgi:alanine racemase